MIVQRVAVIGLGRFGMTVARGLSKLGAQVIAVDRSMQLVNEIKDEVDVAVRLDSTDQEALIAQEINKVDVCVISIGENFEASLLTTVMVLKLGVPRVICRAQSQFHAEIFRQIGAHEVIQPEMSAGGQLARRLANPRLHDVIPLGEEYSLVEIRAPQSWWGKALKDLGLRTKYDVNLVAIKRLRTDGDGREQSEVLSVPRPDEPIQESDLLMLVGDHSAIAGLPRD